MIACNTNDESSNHNASIVTISNHNNAGINNLKKKEYCEAIRQFQTALRCLRTMLGEVEILTNGEQHDHGPTPLATSLNQFDVVHEGEDVFTLSTMTMTMTFATSLACIVEDTRVTVSSVSELHPIWIDTPINDTLLSLHNDTNHLEIMTVIILYNIAISHIGIMKECSKDLNQNDEHHSYERSSATAWKMMMLAHRMIQSILVSLTVDINSIQIWYGIHQIKYRLLTSMLYFVQYVDDNHINHLIFENIHNEIRNVQQELFQYKEIVSVLCHMSSGYYSAACA